MCVVVGGVGVVGVVVCCRGITRVKTASHNECAALPAIMGRQSCSQSPMYS